MRIALNARQLGEHARFFATPPRAARFSPYRLRQLDVIFCQLFTRRARRSAKRTPRAHAHVCEFGGRHLASLSCSPLPRSRRLALRYPFPTITTAAPALVKRIIRARAKTHCRDEVPPAFSSFCLFKDASRAD